MRHTQCREISSSIRGRGVGADYDDDAGEKID